MDQLMLFEGFEVEAMTYKLGPKAVVENVDAVKVDDEVWFLVRGRVTGVNNERKGRAQTFTREQKVEVVGARRVDKDAAIADAIVDEAYQHLKDVPLGHPDREEEED
jgi:hypothetical protein